MMVSKKVFCGATWPLRTGIVPGLQETPLAELIRRSPRYKFSSGVTDDAARAVEQAEAPEPVGSREGSAQVMRGDERLDSDPPKRHRAPLRGGCPLPRSEAGEHSEERRWNHG